MGLGEAYAVAAAATWSLGVIAYSRLGKLISPRRLNLLKNLLVLALLLPASMVVDGLGGFSLSRTELLISLLSGLLGIGLADTLYFRSLNALGAGHMGVVGNLYSPMMIVLSFVFLGERLNLQQVAGFVLVSSGVIVVSTNHLAQSGNGARFRHVLIAALAILLMATSVIMVKRILEHHSVWWVSSVRVAGGVAGLWLMQAGLPRPAHAAASIPLSRQQWVLLGVGAFIGQFLSMLFWLSGYKYTSASVAAILNETASIFIIFFAWLLLGEAVSRRRLLGVALALAGVGLMLW